MKWKTGSRHFLQNLPLLLSLCGVACLNVFSGKTMLAAAVVVCMGAVLSVWKTWVKNPSKKVAWVLTLLWAAVVAVLAVRFYLRMQDNVMTLIFAEYIGVSGAELAFDLAFIGAVISMTAVIFAWAPGPVEEMVEPPAYSDGRRVLAASFLTAFAVIGICSKSSPVYPFNDWVDANCFMTVGKSMLHSLVPYRDLYEQKGPLLYMLHAVAALVSDTTFLGVFILEVAAATAFLFLSYRTVTLLQPGMSLLWLPLIAVAAYATTSFCHGDSAEEFCLPLLAYGVHSGLKAITQQRLPNQRECILIGITSGCVLWIKFSLLGFYLGWFAAFFLLSLGKRPMVLLVKMLGQIMLGVMAASLPVIAYFAVNGAVADLFTVYFYNNLFVYSTVPSENPVFMMFLNLAGGLQHVIDTNRIPTGFLVIGLIASVKSRRFSAAMFTALCWAGLMGLVYIGGRRYLYYSLIFSAFVPLAVPAFGRLQQGISHVFAERKGAACWKAAAVMASFLLAFALCDNTYLLKYKKPDMPQYQFAQIIGQKENATLLDWGLLDGGFYTAADIVPNCRYFCWLNIPLEEMTVERYRYVNEGLVDFVVTRDEDLYAENYELVAESTFYFEGKDHVYGLYQKKE